MFCELARKMLCIHIVHTSNLTLKDWDCNCMQKPALALTAKITIYNSARSQSPFRWLIDSNGYFTIDANIIFLNLLCKKYRSKGVGLAFLGIKWMKPFACISSIAIDVFMVALSFPARNMVICMRSLCIHLPVCITWVWLIQPILCQGENE